MPNNFVISNVDLTQNQHIRSNTNIVEEIETKISELALEMSSIRSNKKIVEDKISALEAKDAVNQNELTAYIDSLDLKTAFTATQLAEMDLSDLTLKTSMNTYAHFLYQQDGKMSGHSIAATRIITHLTGVKFELIARENTVPATNPVTDTAFTLAGQVQSATSPDMAVVDTGDLSTIPAINRPPGNAEGLPHVDILSMNGWAQTADRDDKWGEFIKAFWYVGNSYKAYTSSQADADRIDELTTSDDRMVNMKALFDEGFTLVIHQNHQVALNITAAMAAVGTVANISYLAQSVNDFDIPLTAKQFHLSKVLSAASDITVQTSYKATVDLYPDFGVMGTYLNRNHPEFNRIKTALDHISESGILQLATYLHLHVSQLAADSGRDISSDFPERVYIDASTTTFKPLAYAGFNKGLDKFLKPYEVATDMYTWETHYASPPAPMPCKPGAGLTVAFIDGFDLPFRLVNPADKRKAIAAAEATLS